jgi:hypothetical protein
MFNIADIRDLVYHWFEGYDIYVPNGSIFTTGGPFEIFSYDHGTKQLIVKLSDRLIGNFDSDELVDLMERLDWHTDSVYTIVLNRNAINRLDGEYPPELYKDYPHSTWQESFPNAVSLLI